MERWIKERASKSFGGSCMSKFVQENERKRILRLKNMKSSIVRMSSNKHSSWMKKNVEKRHREIQEQKCYDENATGDDGLDNNSDFDLCYRPETGVTKSGLKFNVASTKSDINAKTQKSTRATSFISKNKLLEDNNDESESKDSSRKHNRRHGGGYIV